MPANWTWADTIDVIRGAWAALGPFVGVVVGGWLTRKQAIDMFALEADRTRTDQLRDSYIEWLLAAETVLYGSGAERTRDVYRSLNASRRRLELMETDRTARDLLKALWDTIPHETSDIEDEFTPFEAAKERLIEHLVVTLNKRYHGRR